MGQNQIPDQLLEECYHLGSLRASEVLLNHNAELPWFILVPHTQLCDLLDLPEHHLHTVLADCAAISAFIKGELGFDKVNFAGLGNVVPDMHLHIIGRHTEDPCWPKPVWGNLSTGGIYTSQQLSEWQSRLVAGVGLTAKPL
jgi:diadenosine tetraphosphate (Ap4A) HIT family hydrolase